MCPKGLSVKTMLGVAGPGKTPNLEATYPTSRPPALSREVAFRATSRGIYVLKCVVNPTFAMRPFERTVLGLSSWWSALWATKVHHGQFGRIWDFACNTVAGPRMFERVVVGNAEIDDFIASGAQALRCFRGGLERVPLFRANEVETLDGAIADCPESLQEIATPNGRFLRHPSLRN